MSANRLPPLNALKAFDAAARHGGFRAAATALNVTHSVIGRHVRGLEARLGVQLFKTRRRGVELTEAGWLYAERIGAALDEIAVASDDIRRQYGSGHLHLLVTAGFASKWLAPRLTALAEQFPDLLIFPEQMAEIDEGVVGDAEFAIGFGRREHLAGDLEMLAAPPFFPVCSPAFLAQHGPFARPADLLDADLLHEDFGDWWREWFAANGLRYGGKARLALWSAAQAIDAACEGKGLALANDLLAGAELRSGRLVEIDMPPFDGGAYWLVWRDGKARSAAAQGVACWIRDQVAQSARPA